MDTVMVHSEIPIVDIAALLPGASTNEYEQRTAVEQLTQACHEQGCVGIKGYGISHAKLTEAFDLIAKLFALPMEDKMKAPHPKGWIPHRGYSAPEREKAYNSASNEKKVNSKDIEVLDEEKQKTASRIVDHRESYEVGSEENKIEYNIWLPEEVFPGFRAFSTELFWELNKLCQLLLNAFCTGLNLTEDERAKLCVLHSGHNNQLRYLHYPPISEEEVNNNLVGRMPAHTDFGTFTLLFQNACEGLEFEDRKHPGHFISALLQEDVLYLNVGDTLTRMSNGYLPASSHRVSVPKQFVSIPGQQGHFTARRYSMPYFCSMDGEAFIGPLATCVSNTTGKEEYEHVTFGEYVKWRFQTLYTKS